MAMARHASTFRSRIAKILACSAAGNRQIIPTQTPHLEIHPIKSSAKKEVEL